MKKPGVLLRVFCFPFCANLRNRLEKIHLHYSCRFSADEFKLTTTGIYENSYFHSQN